MGPVLRIALVLSAFTVLLFVVRKLKTSQFQNSDSMYWLFLSACLLFSALFPKAIYTLSGLLGIQSPSNFVFLAVIAMLLVREFTIQVQLTQLRTKVTLLAQEIALRDCKTNRADNQDPQ
ncbi:DUF2304 domain-containing protein [Collinsella intestinalis]|uniref:DUF2304 domain-containing protein n=1 Tax=Collinsella intestinalis TaxID=147207 RepID=A0A414NFV7_9ACTN|nr:DUF2304 domain-containing protein [Collinsella intestinalis]RHF38700.1 DUF2304 domain-containing protein [Collinsella intestinalis]